MKFHLGENVGNIIEDQNRKWQHSTDKIKNEHIWVTCDPVVEKGRMVTRTKQLTKL